MLYTCSTHADTNRMTSAFSSSILAPYTHSCPLQLHNPLSLTVSESQCMYINFHFSFSLFGKIFVCNLEVVAWHMGL